MGSRPGRGVFPGFRVLVGAQDESLCLSHVLLKPPSGSRATTALEKHAPGGAAQSSGLPRRLLLALAGTAGCG